MILSGSVDVPNEPLSELLATLVPEVFLKPQEGREEVKSSHEVVRTANPLVTLDLNLTFKNADASCQMRQIGNYQGDQWQLSNHVSPWYHQSNEPIMLICVFVKNINQSKPERLIVILASG